MKVVALNSLRFARWAGGRDFLRFIAGGLRAQLADKAAFDVVLPKETPALRLVRRASYLATSAAHLLGALAVRPELVRNLDVAELERMVENLELPGSVHSVADSLAGLREYVRHRRPWAVLPTMTSLGKNFPVPWVGYIYDFQHRHMPEFFLPTTRLKRDRVFGAMLREGRAVLVNSRAVEDDVKTFFPEHRARLFRLPFCPRPTPQWLALDQPEILSLYRASEPYFLISNQTWVHKDHAVAIRATRKFLDAGGRAQLICTGPTHDDRDPTHFSRLLELVRQEGLDDQVRFLGYIPKLHQIQLMKGALAVIQPTLYEGDPGGGSVYDALGLGMRCIVSDIRVNRELDTPLAHFFHAGDAEQLARVMRAVADVPHLRAGDELLMRDAQVRLLKFGKVLEAAIEGAQ